MPRALNFGCGSGGAGPFHTESRRRAAGSDFAFGRKTMIAFYVMGRVKVRRHRRVKVEMANDQQK